MSTRQDMKWLREVHWPDLPAEYKSATIYGNEDSPTQIFAYTSKNPIFTAHPLSWKEETR